MYRNDPETNVVVVLCVVAIVAIVVILLRGISQ